MEYKFPFMNQNHLNKNYSFKKFILNKNQGPIIKRLDSSFLKNNVLKNKCNHSKLCKIEYNYEYENKYNNENCENISFFELEPDENSFISSCNSDSNSEIIIFDIDDINNNKENKNENDYEGLDEIEIDLFNLFKTKEKDCIEEKNM